MWRSVRQTPQAEIRTGTSPAPGSGTPRSSSSSGCPTRLNAIARTMGANLLKKVDFSPHLSCRRTDSATFCSPAATRTGRKCTSKTTLTEARVKALRPRRTTYDIRDGELRGFGIRLLPSGRKRFFVHCQHRGERVWKIVGDAGTMDVRQARSRAAKIAAAIARGDRVPFRFDETLFEAVAETVLQRYARVWKARTMYVNQRYLHTQILPYFAGRRIADIDGQDVRNWLASLRATPVAAASSMPVLSVIMGEDEAMCLRSEGSNPCRGIRRCRRKERERFLSDDESGGDLAVGGRIFPGDLPNAAQARSAEPSEAADGWMATNRSSVQPLS